MNRTVTIAAALFIICTIGYILVIAQKIVLPFVIALFIWNLLTTLQNGIQTLPRIGAQLPSIMVSLLSLSVVLIVFILVGNIVENNLSDVMDASSKYHDHVKRMLSQLDQHFLNQMMGGMESFLKSLEIQDVVMHIYNVFSSFASSMVLIALYVAFLFVEQQHYPEKMARLFPFAKSRGVIDQVLFQVAHDVRHYLGLKTVLSIVTALLSFVVMLWAGLDFADFWALLIFFLSFIPNIGAIIATFFPAVLAFIQFDEWSASLVMTTGLVMVQFIVGNIVEPRLLGRSLNLSPLVILIALAVWGSIWGLWGMFLAVPMMVIMMIVCSHFPATQRFAIILSQNGLIKTPKTI